MTKASDNIFPKVELAEGAAPGTPASARVRLYAKADGLLYSKDDAGVETLVSSGAGGLSDHDHTGGGDGGDLDSPIIDGYAVFNEESAPSTATAGTVRVYAKTDGLMYAKDDAGTETALGSGGGGAPTGAAYVTTEADGTLSAEIVVPGLAGSPDRIPSGVTSLDFQTSTTGLTADGSPTTFDSDTTRESHLFIQSTTGSSFQGGHVAWTPSAGHAAWIKVSAHALAGSFARIGVAAAAASPGGISGLFLRNNAGVLDFEWRDYSAPGTPVNNASQAISDVPYATSLQRAFGPIWLMVVWDSNTSLDFRFSLDGIVFREVSAGFQNHSPSSAFTTGAAAVGMEGEGSVGRAWVDYLRFGDPAAAGLFLA